MNSKSGFFSTKKGKIILFSIIGIVILGIIIAVAIALKKKNNDPICKGDNCPCVGENCPCVGDNCPCVGDNCPCVGDNCPCVGDNCPCVGDNCPCVGDNCPCVGDNCPCEGDDCVIVNVNYKINDVSVYEETLEKNSNIELNEILNENGRRLDEKKNFAKSSIISSKYLFNIYDEQVIDSLTTYYAYVVILNMKQKNEKEETTFIEKDIREKDNVDDNIEAAKVVFNQNGIEEFEINPNMNKTFVPYLYEFVEKIIPKVTKGSFDNNKLDEEKRNYNGDKNNGKIVHNKTKIKSDEKEESKDWEIDIEDNTIKKVKGKKDFAIFVSNENKMSVGYNETENNYNLNVENDLNTNREGVIKQISNNITSEISLFGDIQNDKELTTKISNLLKSINFEPYQLNRRRLNIISKKLDNFRDLLQTEIEIYKLPIYYKYPLFKSHLLGAKIGLYIEVAFSPNNGYFYMKMIFNINGEEKVIFSEKKHTDIASIAENIYSITSEVYTIFTDNAKQIQPLMDDYEIKIGEQLLYLYQNISDYPKVANVFDEELNRVLDYVNQTTANCYNAAHGNTSIANSLLYDILNENNLVSQSYLNQIYEKSNSAINSFIDENEKELDNLYETWNEFYTKSIQQLEDKLSNSFSFSSIKEFIAELDFS